MSPIEKITTRVDGVDNEIRSSALELIGNTPLVALDRVHPGPGRLLAKCEFMNPGHSIKCRSSYRMIRAARESGALKPGMSIIEVTSGNQGTGLAVVSAVLGHPLTLAMSAGNSKERGIHMEALGAKVLRVPQVDGKPGMVTQADIEAVDEEGMRFIEETNAFYVNQFNNEANPQTHYETTGPEIWRQTGQRVDAFVAAVGTAGTFTGTSKYLKEVNPNLKAYVVEPVGAEAIKGKPITKHTHLLQGSSYARVPQLFSYKYMDDTIGVTDEEAVEYKKLVGHKEGLYVGYTSGANVAAAVKLLKSGTLPDDAVVVTTLNDTGLKYSPVGE